RRAAPERRGARGDRARRRGRVGRRGRARREGRARRGLPHRPRPARGAPVSQPFVVFACSECGEKIFAERSQLGRRGQCPLCGAATTVGGLTPSSARERSAERRRARRVPLANARVACETKTGEGRVVNADDLPTLDDISESGVAFRIKGEVDRKRLGGYGAPPWLKIGDTVTVTLHIPQLFRA